MSVRVETKVIHVDGVAQVGDAEPILAALLDDPARVVDLSGATRLHSAVIQLFLALRPQTAGHPADSFYNTHIAPRLDEGQGPS